MGSAIEVVYDRRKPIELTEITRYMDGSAKIVIGTKGATKTQIATTLRHEKAHLKERYKLGTKIWQTVYKRAQAELRAYAREKKQLSASGWNRVLNMRKKDFESYYYRLTQAQQKAIRPVAVRILKRK